MVIYISFEEIQGDVAGHYQKKISFEDNYRIHINLAEIEKAKALGKNIALRDIDVEEKGLTLSVALK